MTNSAINKLRLFHAVLRRCLATGDSASDFCASLNREQPKSNCSICPQRVKNEIPRRRDFRAMPTPSRFAIAAVPIIKS